MRIERLEENKIKITVGGDDIKMWNVDLKNFTDNTAEAQDMFWFALKQAEMDVNFTVGQAQLLVETMPCGDEGFVMFVSRLKDEKELADALVKAGKRAKQAEFRATRRNRACPMLRIFKFRSFDEVCAGVGEIHELYVGSSRLVKYMGDFYLELVPQDTFGIFEMDNILSEFAEREKQPQVLQGVLNEHGKIMIEADAVGKIAGNFLR